MSEFKQYPPENILQAIQPDGSITDLQADQQQARLQVQALDLFELMREMMMVLKKIELHLASLTGEMLKNEDVG